MIRMLPLDPLEHCNKMHKSLTGVFGRNPAIMETDLKTELVAIEGGTGSAFRLNESARAIWLRLPASRDELVQTLIEQFKIKPTLAAADVDKSLQSFLDAGLITQTAAD